MDEETRRRCVEPFFTTKDRPAAAGLGGSGIGMALVHSITERAGGQLRVDSEVGKGTTIAVTVPTAPDPLPEAAAILGQARVSIEDKRMRAVVSDMLRSLRYEIREGHAEDTAASVLWVTDAQSAAPEHAASFLMQQPGRRVIALDGGEAWRRAGAMVWASDSLSSLRQVLTGRMP